MELNEDKLDEDNKEGFELSEKISKLLYGKKLGLVAHVLVFLIWSIFEDEPAGLQHVIQRLQFLLNNKNKDSVISDSSDDDKEIIN